MSEKITFKAEVTVTTYGTEIEWVIDTDEHQYVAYTSPGDDVYEQAIEQNHEEMRELFEGDTDD